MVAEAVAAAADAGATVLLGGGGTSGMYGRYCPDGAKKAHVCTGGGVALELFGEKTLPALAALSDNDLVS